MTRSLTLQHVHVGLVIVFVFLIEIGGSKTTYGQYGRLQQTVYDDKGGDRHHQMG